MTWFWVLAGCVVIAAAAAIFISGRPRHRADQADVTVPLREEQVTVRKRREQLADVRTHTEVVRELKTVTVPVSREEFVVEQDGAEVARIPLREERVDVAVRTIPLNDVSVYERAWQENREIEALVKKEVARVETSGDATVREAP